MMILRFAISIQGLKPLCTCSQLDAGGVSTRDYNTVTYAQFQEFMAKGEEGYGRDSDGDTSSLPDDYSEET